MNSRINYVSELKILHECLFIYILSDFETRLKIPVMLAKAVFVFFEKRY